MSRLKSRGLMLDLARGMERKSFYTEILPHLRDWGYNVLHLHLADDQGCRLAFPRRPELASAGAFSAEEMRALVREARRCRMDVIPEIEALGHTGFITVHPRYRQLGAPDPGRNVFNALDPRHPETRRLLRDLFADTAEIFESPIIHAGLDEVDFSRLPRYRKLPREKHWPLFAEHAARVHEMIRSFGRRPAMWGDHILSARQMATRFKSDVLVFDWHYRPEVDPESLDFLTGAGFEVWAAPAVMWWYIRLLSGLPTVRNIREFSAHAAQPQRKKVTGVVNTVWCPWRYLPGAMDWPIAWAGHVFSSEIESKSFCRTFCRDFYGLGAGDASVAADAFLELYSLAPDGPRIDAVMNKGLAFTRERIRECTELLPRFTALARTLQQLLPRTRRHAERFHDVLLSARILERWATLAVKGPDDLSRAAGERLSRACTARWLSERPYPTPVFPAAGRYQHILSLAEGLVSPGR